MSDAHVVPAPMLEPIHYVIRLTPDLENFTFDGTVSLEIQAHEPVQELVLNTHELEIQLCTLLQGSSKHECTFSFIPDRQEVVIHLLETVTNQFTLVIQYSGLINDRYAGLYRSTYTHNGQQKYLASSQFEAKDARRAFPCFDQPGKKATFDIEYVIQAGLTGISNTAVISEQPLDDGKKLVKFATTPRMSTYLVFFGIGEFEFIEDTSAQPLVRVAVTPGKTAYGRFALDMARKSLSFGADYTGIPFPLSKCDYIAVPDSMGAMENFGAIRHSEDNLLVYPDVTPKAQVALTAKIIAHEGIHQWFGDLVSPAAWKYLWLNEAFATYFTYVIPHHFYPHWQVWDQFFHERLLTGMERDALPGTIPIDLPYVEDLDADPAPTPSTSPIVYNKGAAVLRMLVAYLGERRFKQAIHHFLAQYQFEAASSTQFWESISRSAGTALDEFARTWTVQPGYPLVSVERHGRTLSLTQTRFTYSPQPAPVSTWVVPIDAVSFLTDGSSQISQILLDQPNQVVLLPENTTAYKLNTDFTGFYRVCYPQEDLEKIGKLIRSQRLSAVDSLNVLSDFFALVKAGIYTVNKYLRYVETYLTGESRCLPLTDLVMNLSHLYRVVHTKRNQISRLGNLIFEGALGTIGSLPVENEGLLVTELRANLLTAAFMLGSERVSEFGKAQFQSLLDGGAVHRDILSAVLKIAAAAHPQAADWLKARAANNSLPEAERIQVLEALGNLAQIDTLKDALELNMAKIPSSLRHHMLAAACNNPNAMGWLWDWFLEHHGQVEQLPLSHLQNITVRLVSLCGIGRRQEVETLLKQLVARYPVTAGSMTMALELLEVNERLLSL